MNPLEECSARCPYCGESIRLLVDCSLADQQYTEDCPVCCQPIEIHAIVHENGPALQLDRENH